MSASVVLCDVQLDDIRPDRQNFITRFMKKKEIDSSPDSSTTGTESSLAATNSMVDIVVSIKPDETFANLKVSSFDLILSLEYLLKIAQFVTIPDDSTSKPIAAATSAATTASAVNKRTV